MAATPRCHTCRRGFKNCVNTNTPAKRPSSKSRWFPAGADWGDTAYSDAISREEGGSWNLGSVLMGTPSLGGRQLREVPCSGHNATAQHSVRERSSLQSDCYEEE